MDYPSQDLVCPDPTRCPVIKPAELGSVLHVEQIAEQTVLYRVYDGAWGYDEPNPGFGDARFSPFDALSDGRRVPVRYVAQTPAGALLETIFHDVHQSAARIIYEGDLRRQLLAHLATPARLNLVDLRDEALGDLGIRRDQLVSTSAEHYPCTRMIAQQLHDAYVDRGAAQGFVWDSRQAELHDSEPALAMVIYTDSYNVGRGGWKRLGPGSQDLFQGPGRLLVDTIANALKATIVSQ
ncbi:hypothetical protein GCM10011575_13540 [Microlunatus endophyticus]|uniref:RES domain-containing protein n=2 Tax=Microlunatus endophyticus TaxID=1716077 RepID=A0A917S692_9ACTN|nr:hypothetical protein GCM10011575_13540 [Microlunatus endophyticus]